MCDSMNGKLSGQEYWLDVNLGSDALPVTNMNVISFELKYTGTQYIDYLAYEIGSFLAGATPTVIPDDPNGTISVSAFNLTQGYTGYGQAFRFKFKVKDGVTDPQWIQMYWGLVSANTVGGGVQLLDTLGCGEVIITDIVSIDVKYKPDDYILTQNYPNPFNPITRFNYSIPVSSFVTLKVYDIVGNEVALLVNEYQEIGFYEVTFNANNLSNGIYFYELQTNEYKAVKKLVLMR